MFKAKTKKTLREFIPVVLIAVILTIVTLLLCVGPGCVSPDAVKTDIQGIRNDMGNLEELVDQKADAKVVAEHVENIYSSIQQITQVAEQLSLWRTSIEADTIHYGGAGWVVVGTGVMAVIFIGAGLLLVRAFMNRGNLLTLLTCAIQKVGKRSPETIQEIKKQLKVETSNGGPFTEQDRKNLGIFVSKRGTFAEQK